jgi:LppX/LprAFG-like lipoprotein
VRRLPLALAALLFAACSLGQSSTDPGGVLRAAGPALAALRSVAVDLKFGPGAEFQGITLVSASSKLRLPDASDTTLKAQQLKDSLIELRIVTLGSDVYVQAPFVGFTQLSGSEAAAVPALSRFFDPTSGLPALLPRGSSPALLGAQAVDGVDCWEVRALYPADRVAAALPPLKPASGVTATLWIGKADHRLRKAHLQGPLYGSEQTTLDVRLHDFDAAFQIVRPSPAAT